MSPDRRGWRERPCLQEVALGSGHRGCDLRDVPQGAHQCARGRAGGRFQNRLLSGASASFPFPTFLEEWDLQSLEV